MKTIKILKNWHYAINQLPFLPVYVKKHKTVTRIYQFTDSCRYSIDEPSCVNKLFGWSIGMHHTNSVRVGWSYDNQTEMIQLWSYYYIGGKLEKKKLCQVNIDEDVKISIASSVVYLHGKNTICYDIFINDRVLDMKITDEKIKSFGYTLETYFGGESKAPHKILIKFKKM
jgi:hypothetical protein